MGFRRYEVRRVLSIILCVLCTLNILDELFNKRNDVHFVPSLVAESLKVLTFLFALILISFNRKKGRHTSGILFIFWLSLTFCEIFPYRTAFITLQTEDKLPSIFSFVTEMIYFPILVAQLILSCFADIKYRHPSEKEGKKECPELRASFASKLVFWWFNRMSILGWKRPLKVEDLWELNPENRTDYIASQFEKHYRQFKWAQPVAESKIREEEEADDVKAEEQVLKDGTEYIVRNGRQDNPKEKIHILRSLYKTFAGTFISGGILKLIYDLLQFINPLILG